MEAYLFSAGSESPMTIIVSVAVLFSKLSVSLTL